MKKLFIFIFLIHGVISIQSQTINLQNFNTGINGGWTAVNGGTTPDTWVQTANFAGNTLNGSGFAFCNSDAVPQTPARLLEEFLTSPVFNGNLYTNVYLEFDHYYRDYSTDTGFVDVYNGTSWIRVAFYSSNQGGWSAPSHVFLDLTLYRNPSMQVRFRYDDNNVWAWYWAVDNVLLYAPYPIDARLLSKVAPNSDCAMTPSEPVTVNIYNAGSAPMTSYSVTYQINGGAAVTENVTTTIAPVDTLTYTFTTLANLSTPGSYNFKFWVTLPSDGYPSNDTLNNQQVIHFPYINSFPYVQDFETGPAGWEIGGVLPSWILGTPAKPVIIGASSGTQAWVTGGLGTGDYNLNEKSFVYSPCFDFTNMTLPWVVMDVWWNSQYSVDGAALQASTNSGQTWVLIGLAGDLFNWYNDNTISGLPGGQQQGWTGRNSQSNGSAMWKNAKHQLASFAGRPEVIFRVAFGADGATTDDGFAFDRFILTDAPDPNLGPDTTICDSIVLNPGPGFSTVAWNNGDTTYTTTAYDDGVFISTVSDSFGIVVKDTIQISLFQTNQPTLGSDLILCEGETVLLDAGNIGISYAWNTGDSTQLLLVDSTGSFSVFVTFPYGCTGDDQIDIALTTLNAGYSEPDTLCRNEPVQFTDTSSGATSWNWDFGNGFSSSLQNPSFIFQSGGTYMVTLAISDGQCTDTITKSLFVQNCINTSAQHAAENKFEIFPNPASGSAKILFEGNNSEWRASLTDLRGVELASYHSFAGQNFVNIDLQNIPAGLYWVKVAGAMKSGDFAGQEWVKALVVE